MVSWTGITAVTAYSPVLLKAAGYRSLKQNGLAGGLNTIGIISTIISTQVVDRLGRRKCLIGGAFGLLAVNLIAASLYEASRRQPSKVSSFASAAVTMFFLFNLCYAATWGTVTFLIPTEIFPSEMRAQGNGFGITGWAIGVGWTVLVNPIMFGSVASRTYFLFAGLILLWMPTVFFFCPETAPLSLLTPCSHRAVHFTRRWRRPTGAKAMSWPRDASRFPHPRRMQENSPLHKVEKMRPALVVKKPILRRSRPRFRCLALKEFL